MDDLYDIAIIGGGAAGLTAGIFAAQTNPSLRIAIFDTAKSLGAKILVSGGGRCNVTHDHVTPADFNGPHHPIRNVLAAFNHQAAIDWFQSLGVELKREETGKLFPMTDSARTVLNALLARCNQLNVTLLTNHRVMSIDFSGSSFIIHPAFVAAKRLILCAGGRSLPKTGSDGSGYTLARLLGHTTTATYAALVPLVCAGEFFHADLAGLSLEAEFSTFADQKRIDRRTGSLLFTHFGLSGPLAMDASRHYLLAKAAQEDVVIKCNFLPGRSFDFVDSRLTEFAVARNKSLLSNVLASMIPARLADALLKHLAIPGETMMSQLSKEVRRSLAHGLTALPLPILHDRGWNYAEVTAGGVPLSEVDFRSMESRKCPGLYFAGEILDVDGRIGGFNFQWAWSTGFLAGTRAARSFQA